MRAIDPIVLQTIDGEERKLLLTLGGLRRLQQRSKQFANQDISELGITHTITILWEALIDKGDLTEDQFADLVPANGGLLRQVVRRLTGEEDRPTDAAPAADAASTGLKPGLTD